MSRPKMPILYGKDERFPIPGFKVLRKSDQDKATVIGAGIALHEALKAADQLKSTGTAIRVIDLYCVKPLDGNALGQDCGNGWTTCYRRGSLGRGRNWRSRVGGTGTGECRSFKSRLLAVRNMPHSGKPDELIDAFGISAQHIVEAVNAIA